MSLSQACAEVEAIIERARSLFGTEPGTSAAAHTAADHLSTASTATSTAGRGTAELSGELVTAHRGFTDRATATLDRAAHADTTLSARMEQATALTQSGATRLAALAQESQATARAAATATTPAGQRAILMALKSQVDRAARIVDETQRRAGELAGGTHALDQPLDPSPTPDPSHLAESTLDGVHGTGSRDTPIVTRPGELGPPNTGMFPGGTDYVEAVPGSGVWIPSDQISGKLWMPSQPGELAPSNYEEIAPGIWWPQAPAVDPPMDGRS